MFLFASHTWAGGLNKDKFLDAEYRKEFFKNYTSKRKAAGASNDDVLYVHLIPHTHDDVGWLKTVDGYFTGDRVSTARVSVESILDNVIEEL